MAAMGRGPAGRGSGPRGREAAMRGGKPKNSGAAVKRLLKYLKKDWYLVLFALICVLAFSASSLLGSYMLKPVVNELTEDFGKIVNASGTMVETLIAESIERLVYLLILMGVIYAVGVVANYLQMRIMLGVSQRALIRIRKDLFDHLQELPIRYFDTNSTGDIMSRFTNDVDTIGELLNNTVIQLMSGLISIFGTLSIMLIENIWLALVTVVMIPVMFKVGSTLVKKSASYYRAQQEALGTLNGYIEETVTGQKVVKVFCHEKKAVEEFCEKNDDLRNKQAKARFFGGIMGPVMGNLGQVCYGLTACIGGILCLNGMLTIGGLTIFVNYSRQFARPINELCCIL